MFSVMFVQDMFWLELFHVYRITKIFVVLYIFLSLDEMWKRRWFIIQNLICILQANKTNLFLWENVWNYYFFFHLVFFFVKKTYDMIWYASKNEIFSLDCPNAILVLFNPRVVQGPSLLETMSSVSKTIELANFIFRVTLFNTKLSTFFLYIKFY